MNKTRWLTLALLISLGINLLGVGLLVGRSVFDRPPVGHFPPNLGWILRDLQEPSRQQLRPLLEEHARRVMPLRREMRGAQRDFGRLLVQPEFDKDAVEQSLQSLRAASDRYQLETHQTMLQVLPGLSADQRLKAATFLNRNRISGGPKNSPSSRGRDQHHPGGERE